jgi:hypothetical protein
MEKRAMNVLASKRGLLRAATAFTFSLMASTAFAQTLPTTGDPREGLKGGDKDFAEVAKGMRLVSLTPKAAMFDSARGLTFANSDLAFRGNYVYQGNFRGFTIWDVTNKAAPKIVSTFNCATSQGDPSIFGNLLFISAESGAREDCLAANPPGATPEQNNAQRMTGVRIFDVSNPAAPKLVKNVNNCKGSHTHTLIPSQTDKNIVYIYISGGGNPRTDRPGCDLPPEHPDSYWNRLDIIKVDIRNPQAASVIGGAKVFENFTASTPRVSQRSTAPRGGGGGGAAGGIGRGNDSTGGRGARGGGRGAGADTTAGRGRGRGGDTTAGGGRGRAGGAGAQPPRIGPSNCHDVSSYPEMGLLAGACGSRGLLVDVSNPEKPVRLDAAADTNFGLWHTAVFSNDGKKVVFTDEWGGGTGPMCQAMSPLEWGANTVLTIGADKKFKQHAYFKLPAVQTAQENCVSHNGSLIPVPGRDIMVQGWYQGGVDVFDFTNPDKPFEIAYHDRGPINPTQLVTGGSWGAYWYNGYIYSSEIHRGFDILELVPSEHLSANEIAAAKSVVMAEFNPQAQPKIVWPASFAVVRSYVDQLERGKGIAAARVTALNTQITAAERAAGAARRTALTTLATAVDRDVAAATDKDRVRALATAIRDLAAATR